MSYFALGLFIFFVFCAWLKHKYNYWKRRGVTGPKPWPVVGNAYSIMLARESIHDFAERLYEEFPNEKVVGFYQGVSPALLVRDADLIKEIAVKNYESFNSRGMRSRDDPYDDNLFFAEGETWKILRHKFNPLFSSGKVKQMMPLVHSCVQNFLQYVDKMVTSGRTEQDVRDLCRLLMLDINGTCCFGVSMDVYSERQNVFVDLAEDIFSLSTTLGMKRFMQFLFPRFIQFLTRWCDPSVTVKRVRKFFNKLIKDIVKTREGKVERNGDLMDLLVDLKAEGRAGNNKATVLMDDEFVATQSLTFYVAGFEPTSLFLCFLFYEMALHQDMQQRLFEEISDIASKYGGRLTHESVNEMKYLQMAFQEILRKYSISLSRKCTKTCNFPGHNLTIDKGTTVIIPVPGFHHDPKYFSDPLVFDPERFSPENRRKIPPVYLPFGYQFGRVQCLMGAASFFHKFRLNVTEKTPRKLTTDPRFITLRTVERI